MRPSAYPPDPRLYYSVPLADVEARDDLLAPPDAPCEGHCLGVGERVPWNLLFPCCRGTSFDEASRTCVAAGGVCGLTRHEGGGRPIDAFRPCPAKFAPDEDFPDVAYDVGLGCAPNARGSLYAGFSEQQRVTCQPVVPPEPVEAQCPVQNERGLICPEPGLLAPLCGH